jgi:transposase-like protein
MSLLDVGFILVAQSIEISYEIIREWSLHCGLTYACSLKRRQPQSGDG